MSKLIKMIPDPVSQPEAFDPAYPKDWMARDIADMSKENPWLNMCNLAQCIFYHQGKPLEGVKVTYVTDHGTATFDSLDLAFYWLICMDEWRPSAPKKDPA